MTLAAGTRLGHYEILGPLGSGGMGEVYRARDTSLAREVAVKVLPEQLARDPESLGRFEREARAVAALSHPNILDVHEFGNEKGVLFLAMELLEGETLRRRLGGAPLPWRRALEIGHAIAEGLAAAHERGIVHRDLKPDNVFVTFDGRVKILDFGLARLERSPLADDSPTVETPVATQSGVVIGTVGYMSPEQARGATADARTDIFALGCVLYEMVTGRRAFSGDSVAETMVKILKEEPPEPQDLVPEIPEDLNRIILRCVAKYPESRFQSARDLAFALRMVTTAPGAAATRRPHGRRLPSPIVLAGVAAVLVILVVLATSESLRPAGPIDSLAVLPFTNAANDPKVAYLSEGITESVINNLLQLSQLRVIPRASVYAYRGDKNPLEAGKELNVRAVLTGQVKQVGDRLAVQAELTDVKLGSELWGQRFHEPITDVLEVQEKIAQEILKSLRVELSGEQEQRLSRRDPQNAEAYDLYLQGRYHWNKRTADGIARSIGFFEQAIARDPAYALAHAGLADAYLLVAFYGALPPNEIVPKARAAAMKALALDADLAEAHATIADLRYQFEWDWEGAEKGYRRAIALNPNYPTARQWYANFLALSGRPEAACREIIRARELDPLNLVITMDVGFTCYYAGGDIPKAIEQYRKVLELEPNFALARFYLGLAHIRANNLPAAIAELEAVQRLEPGPDSIALLGYAKALAGRRSEAEQALVELAALSRERFVSSFPIAFLYLGLGRNDRALDALEKAFEERAGRLVYVYTERAFDPVRSDPRFQDLLRRLRFPAGEQRASRKSRAVPWLS